MRDLICDNVTAKDGVLYFAGQNTIELAKKYGTPLYLSDENKIRENCRTYISAAREALGDRFEILYASKAASFKIMYEIMRDEGMGVDVVSSGEIMTAIKAAFPLEKAYFHSNNKTDEDIRFAIENGIGCFVVDNVEELYAVDRIAREYGCEHGLQKKQNVLLRITPGVDPHTFAQVSTGKVDSKFGSAIETGQAFDITKIALSLENIHLSGFHCHVGSQVFESEVYFTAIDIMLDFVGEVKKRFGYATEKLDLGGGIGVRYTENDPKTSLGSIVKGLCSHIKDVAKKAKVELPIICFEPGRSIVANAGMTLYTVGTLKKIPGYKIYASVDGSMADSPRYALYRAKYTFLSAQKMNEPCNTAMSVVGRCCESGDILGEEIPLPESTCRGDVLAQLTTGAYHYSMASNYNRLPRPPIVMLCGESNYIAVRRETLDDIVALDV